MSSIGADGRPRGTLSGTLRGAMADIEAMVLGSDSERDAAPGTSSAAREAKKQAKAGAKKQAKAGAKTQAKAGAKKQAKAAATKTTKQPTVLASTSMCCVRGQLASVVS